MDEGPLISNQNVFKNSDTNPTLDRNLVVVDNFTRVCSFRLRNSRALIKLSWYAQNFRVEFGWVVKLLRHKLIRGVAWI